MGCQEANAEVNPLVHILLGSPEGNPEGNCLGFLTEIKRVICVSLCLCAYMHICVSIYMHLYCVCICVCIYAYTLCVHIMRVCIYKCVWTDAHIYKQNVCFCLCIYIYIYYIYKQNWRTDSTLGRNQNLNYIIFCLFFSALCRDLQRNNRTAFNNSSEERRIQEGTSYDKDIKTHNKRISFLLKRQSPCLFLSDLKISDRKV